MPVSNNVDGHYVGSTRIDRAYFNGTAIELPLRKRGNGGTFVKSPYQCYLGMWGIFIPSNDLMTFTCDLLAYPNTFPAGTTISWNVIPDPDWPGINGYLAISYGNYDDNAVTITSRQVYTITALEMSVDWTFTGSNATGLLCECWLTPSTAPSGQVSQVAVAEIGFLGKVSPHAQAFLNSLAVVGIGSFVDGHGVTWNVRYSPDGTSGHYYLAYRNSFADHVGAFPFKDYFAFLIAAGRITGNEWFNGLAFGPECDSGSSSVTINSMTPTYTGAARVPWTIADLAAVSPSTTQINLTWTAAPGATSHQYRVNGGSYITTSGPTSQSVTGLTPATLYSFEVRGVNATGNALASNTASATTGVSGPTNIIGNGSFNDTSVWTGQGISGLSVSGGKGHLASTPIFNGMAQSISPVSGKYYVLTYTISNYSSGSLRGATSGGTGAPVGATRSANGTYSELLLMGTGNNLITMQALTAGTTLDIDDVSLFGPFDNLVANGAFADTSVWAGQGSNGKSISAGKGHFAASTPFDGGLNQTVAPTGGKYYMVTFTVSNRSAGDVTPFLYNGSTNTNGTFRAANGTYSELLLARANDVQFGINPTATPSTTLDVDDVSVIGPYTNLIGNGTFADATGWTNLGFSGKSVTGGKLVFASTPAYDAAIYLCSPIPGKYYELTYTVSGYSAGNIQAPLLGGTNRLSTVRTANGTYTERLLANTGNTELDFRSNDITGTFSIDNVSLIGPFDTPTVGGL